MYRFVASALYPKATELVLVVCESLPNGRMKRIEEFQHIEDELDTLLHELKLHGCFVSLSPIIKTREEALKGSPIFLDMVEDAVILYDKDGFFAGVLKRLRIRLDALGAKRVWRGSAWYWDLKPDFEPGEVFEL